MLRLLFASLVIIGHAPEFVDGSRAREPLTMVFHTLSLGELSVDAFFLLSGYLITRSMVRTGSVGRYLEHRILRIYPAFIAAYLLTVFVLGPLMGAEPWRMLPGALIRLVLLHPPMHYPSRLPGMPLLPALNGAMWTIAYEFRCYLLVAAFFATGLLPKRMTMLAITIGLLTCSAILTYAFADRMFPVVNNQGAVVMLIGQPSATIRLTSIFLVGVCFCLFREDIDRYMNAGTAAGCAAVTAALLYRDPHFAEAGLVTFGAIALFWVALKARLGAAQRINDAWDISYGVYLYGWPVATYFRWRDPALSPWSLAAWSLGLALLLGAASWWGVERWTRAYGRSRSPRATPARSRSGDDVAGA